MHRAFSFMMLRSRNSIKHCKVIPARLSTLRSAKVAAEVAQANYQVVVQTVLADVASNYFAHLRNLRRLDVLDANIRRAKALLQLARNQLADYKVPRHFRVLPTLPRNATGKVLKTTLRELAKQPA